MKLSDQIFAILQEHCGREHAISGPALARRIRRYPERHIRAVIAEHANDKWPGVLCAIPGTGYFFATSLEDIVTYRQYLVSLKDEAKAKLARFDASVEKSGFHLKEAA